MESRKRNHDFKIKPMLSEKEKERYSRHLLLEEIGEQGQEKIKNAKVLVVGAGGLGSPVLLYLVAAGIGQIGIMDDDTVSESNLQRQVLYDIGCIGELKTEVAARKLQILNPHVRTCSYTQRFTLENSEEIVKKYDVVIDATDNLLSRYAINDICVKCGKPFVYGSICEFDGQVSVFNYQNHITYRDLYEYHEGIREFRQPLGVIGALPGVVGSIQATEAIKVILNRTDTLSGKLLLINLLKGTFQLLEIQKNQ